MGQSDNTRKEKLKKKIKEIKKRLFNIRKKENELDSQIQEKLDQTKAEDKLSEIMSSKESNQDKK